ncbi:MAG: hypothetical protein QOI24_3623 [Acidobacteriota bacterium]|jgi:hypothetical protein|nr:hypothetical protein [Acidobacteriota bacterium]
MLGLDMLDVAIGVVFVFLLVSLIASAIAEYIENFLKYRASDLEKGILEMLRGDTKLLQQVYEHPLILSLYEGKSHAEAKGTNKLPAYIPARSFALAMMDLFMSTDDKSGAAGATPADAPISQPVAGDVKADPSNQIVQNAAKIKNVAEVIVKKLREVATKAQSDATERLTPEQRLQAMPADVAKVLVTAIDAAGGDASKVRANIEGWFNSSMDRVSGWYKRRSHKILVGIGLLLAIAFNIDTIAIVQSLWMNKGMRDAAVSAAGAFAKHQAGNLPATTTTAASPAQPDPTAEAQRIQKNISTYATSLNALKLPIGWEREVESWRDAAVAAGSKRTDVNVWCKAIEGSPMHLIGWLITAAAVSMGAPFWFDTLNKIMVIRSTVKPREKSAEEAPKEHTTAGT